MKLRTLLMPLAGLVAFLATAAHGNSIQVDFNPGTTSGIYSGSSLVGVRYGYTATLVGNSTLQTNDYFVIFDFAGYQTSQPYNGVSDIVPAGWSVSYADFDQTMIPPPVGSISQNPSIKDLIVTYTGSATLTSPPNTILGGFAFVSSETKSKKHAYLGVDHNASNDQESNASLVLAPDPNGGPTPLPVPAAAVGGLGLLGLFAGTSRRSKRA